MVYEANARVRDPVYGCVGAISSLQQQIDMLRTQLAMAQAEVVQLRLRQSTSITNSPPNSGSPIMGSQPKGYAHFHMDLDVDQSNGFNEPMWPY